jgi:cytochrome c peroxidase
MEYQSNELARLLPSVDVSKVPPGFDPVVWEAFIPEDNVMTVERVALGRKLYFEKRLSADGTVSCATCHDVTRGFTDQLAVSEGIKDQLGRRNAPTTLPDTGASSEVAYRKSHRNGYAGRPSRRGCHQR